MGRISETVWDMDPHTEVKHAIFKRYLEAWIPILSKYHDVNIIDGFAGPGEYKNGKEGSPVIAIRTLIEHKIQITSDVLFIFIEKDKKRCDCLEKKLSNFNLPDNVRYDCVCGKFKEVITGILSDLKKSKAKLAPTFVFIDPFGFTDFPFELIKNIMDSGKCEVLINFMFEDINRFIELPQNEKSMQKLFGVDKWKNIKGNKDPSQRLIALHGLYKIQLEKIAKHVISFKMKNKFNKVDYFLFFATNSLLGLKKMKEAMWKADPGGSYEFSDATHSPTQTLLYGKEPNYNLLKKLILNAYKGKKIKVEDLEYFILTKTHFRESHYKTKILRLMEKNNEINILRPEGKRKGTFPDEAIIEFL